MLKFWRNKLKSNAYKVWGIRAPDSVKDRWISLSIVLGVPCNRLILFILKDWLILNGEKLKSKEIREQFANRITEAYLAGELE